MFRLTILSAALAFAPLGALAQTTPAAPASQPSLLTLDFLPPALAPRDVCNAPSNAAITEDLADDGEGQKLTNLDRIRFIRRDIRNHTDEDADGFFDFINALITRRAKLDETFTDIDAIFARINLMLRAGRTNQLVSDGLVESLRDRVSDMTNTQRVQLARFYADGTGVIADTAFAQELIREAAYGGNANALLEIVRLEQQGTLIDGWDAPLDLTVTMAFGGILGPLDHGVCGRAARIAQEYTKGDLVAANPALALAWHRFAADMGGAESAWRLVEFHLNADAVNKDNIELRKYLKRAVQLGVTVNAADRTALTSSGSVSEAELANILGFNHSQDTRRTARGIAPLLQLVVNIDGLEADEDSLFLDYLREISAMPEAPGRVFDRLAGEVLVRKGRWAGEAEALQLLEQAVVRGDGAGQRRLAKMLIRYRDDPAQVARAESLLMEVVSRHGIPEGMRDLDTLYRCQANDAPRLQQAEPWAKAYRATGHATLPISASDLLALSPNRSPEEIAQIQSQALDGRPQMLAAQAQRVQADPLASASKLRFWAEALNRSDKALEEFAEYEFELATSPAERDLAIEFFRRVYLNNGVTTALDLAIALTGYNARDPEIAKEIEHLLTMAGNRGEGGAIRLLSRLQANERPELDVFNQFADKIEERGDFLALMFAMPHIGPDKVDDYIDRAVSLMSCGTKDADELGDAHAIRADAAGSHHWRLVGLTFEGGHVLSKLRLTNPQVDWFKDGAAPDPVARATRELAEGDTGALMRLVRLTANPDLPSYDAAEASKHMLAVAMHGSDDDVSALLSVYRGTSSEVRRLLDPQIELNAVLQRVAQTGNVLASYELGMRLRDGASGPADLSLSLDWLEAAAKRGHRDAMYQTGFALGFGLGRIADVEAALGWLDQAAGMGHQNAAQLAKTLRVSGGQ
ncbi:SEL1-like repeat protein [Lentibacter algarum]|uniref:tetratricopeptide repeat protein n=1 Tax=Lentibacter algarum TaxID=576131 RepID=UPI001C07A6D0|nr:SEL1-like repeat protein [Lentibacter algarum]MBU2981403.1 SEL1-like repeat protein [Lentibacter algarum]